MAEIFKKSKLIFTKIKNIVPCNSCQIKNSCKNDGVSTGLQWLKAKGEKIQSFSPVDGKLIATVTGADKNNYDAVIIRRNRLLLNGVLWPAPKRGEIVRQINEELRKNKQRWSAGKLRNGQKLTGRVRRSAGMIDICDFAVGLSASCTV